MINNSEQLLFALIGCFHLGMVDYWRFHLRNMYFCQLIMTKFYMMQSFLDAFGSARQLEVVESDKIHVSLLGV